MTFQISTLPSGLRVATLSMPHVHSATFGVFADVGARHESVQTSGISHFLEHMAFKGTLRRSARDIAFEFDAIGGASNAYTSHENTVYYAKVLQENLHKAVDIIADITVNSVLPEDEVERERQVIIQEIAMSHDSPDDVVYENFQSACFSNQALGRPIIGNVQNVSAFSRADIYEYRKAQYTAENMLVVAAGSVNHGDILEEVAHKFDGIKASNFPKAEVAGFTGGEIRKQDDLEQLHMLIGFQGLSYTDEDYYALQIAGIILGGGMSSRLFQEIRENRGLCYSVYAFSSSYVDTGTFAIYSGSAPDKAAEIISVAGELFCSMTASVSDEEINRAKAQVKSGILMALERTTAQFETVGRHILYLGRYIPAQEIIRRIDAVTIADVQKVIEKISSQQKYSVSVLGDVSHVPDYNAIGRAFIAHNV